MMVDRFDAEIAPYESSPRAVMEKFDCGDWVAYEDYAKLQAEVERLKAENTKLTEALKTIRDAGLEPIDPAYREYARAALEEGE